MMAAAISRGESRGGCNPHPQMIPMEALATYNMQYDCTAVAAWCAATFQRAWYYHWLQVVKPHLRL